MYSRCADGDGRITMLDYLYLKRYILGTYNGETVLENADVNGGGKTDVIDYICLKRGYLGTINLSQFARSDQPEQKEPSAIIADGLIFAYASSGESPISIGAGRR